MSDRFTFLAGIVYALAGLGLLAHADLPVILRGGVSAIGAGFELTLAMVVLSLAFGLATRHGLPR